jgi:hypothetical protein
MKQMAYLFLKKRAKDDEKHTRIKIMCVLNTFIHKI